jgi:sigma-E factor negative regulatory protein RseA
MNTTRLQENISALTDGELPACDVELTMAALADPQGEAAWRAYRLIGDVLRADAAEVESSPGFAARLATRLAAEPLPGHPVEPGPQGSAAAADGARAAGLRQEGDDACDAGADAGPDGAGGPREAGANAGTTDVPALPSAPPAAEGPAPALVP